LGRETEAHGEMPTFRGADAWTDMVPHPLPARLRLNAGEDVEACLEPRREPMRDFDGLMHRMLRGEYAILFGRGPFDRAVTMELEHGLARCDRLGAIDLNLEVALGIDVAGPPPAYREEDDPDRDALLEKHTACLRSCCD